MQICQRGDFVRVRRQRWRVVDVRPYRDCTEVALAGASASNLNVEQRVLAPFDRLEPGSPPARARRARTATWRRECRRWLAEHTPPGSLRAAHLAGIELRPHQLEPALAVAQGRAVRLLLADAVGLGKTIQAALAITELRARGAGDRVLVLTPAGLRDQWAGELRDRFGLDAAVCDSAELRRRAARLPPAANPWTTTPVAIASIDYVKQAHVLPSVAARRWDVLVIDEAHGVAGDSERHAAARALAGTAAYVLLLSATPHNGDPRAFQALCDLGAHRDRLLVFRRTRRDVPLAAPRKVRQLRVRAGPAERRLQALLDRFAQVVRRDRVSDPRESWLALAVLRKRALSSPFALRRSVERRLATLGDRSGDAADGPRQLGLPWPDPDGETTGEDVAPEWPAALALASGRHERSWLERLAAAGREASAESSKLSALVRLLRRVHEPAIVFTEYRDTLHDVARRLAEAAAILHGGLLRAERNHAIDAFASGRARLLLATDAAAEGLNLQERCRLVINFELPWNPMRLEQRIGRVDRIGQRSAVHAVHFMVGDLGEAELLAALRAKIARARADVGSADPLDNTDEPVSASLAGEAEAEAARLHGLRRLRERGTVHRAAPGGALLARTRHRRTRAHLAGRPLLLFRASLADRLGRRVESALVPVTCASRHATGPTVVTAVSRWAVRAANAHDAFLAAAIAREQRIHDARRAGPRAPLFQPELFSRRADREREQGEAWLRSLDADAEDRLALLERAKVSGPCRIELLLVLVP